ncbi:response regulator transcription factor [uncultured Algimonas sp.]|uniref:response regulator transcription factor n=1 Tax=uncultured Algimonas sp. TaxID=1547920 RepID=UPI002604E5BF|nr:response regulator transcription factor [uncultured Algimonas sp.]
MRLLLVEDHASLADAMSRALQRAGFAVDHAANVEAAQDFAAVADYDLILMDLGLPDGDGLDLLGEIRRDHDWPAIILTARDALPDRLAGLDGGADDYIVKPVDMLELVARCRAVMRRPGGRLGTVLETAGLTLDTTQRRVAHAGRTIALGRRDIGVLEQLMRRKGQVVPRAVLEDAVYALDDAVTPNALEAAVSRIRKGLSEAGCAANIHTVRGVGWLLDDTADASG